MPHLYGDAGVLPSDRPDSPSKDQVSTSTHLTNLTNQQDYLFPTTSNESFLSKLHSADTMYARSAYEWPYTSGLKTTDTSPWLDMSTPAAAGSWFSDMTAPAPMMSYPAHFNPAEINYAQLSSSMVLPSTHSNPVLPETRYLQSIPESFKTSSVTPTNYTSTATSSTTPTSTTPLTQPSRSKRNKGGSICACPNCQEIDKLGPSAAHLKAKGPHSCHFPGCGKVYNRSSHLKAHIRWHTGDRQFACNWLFCGKRFTSNDELQKHLRTHPDEKRFTCPTCNKQFMKKDHLSKHIKTHEDGTLEPPTPSPPCTPSPSAADVANNNIDSSFISKQKMMVTYAYNNPTANDINNHL